MHTNDLNENNNRCDQVNEYAEITINKIIRKYIGNGILSNKIYNDVRKSKIYILSKKI